MPQNVVFDEAYFDDPSSTYDWLREHGPVHRFVAPTGVTGWLVTDYEAARAVLFDNTVFGKTQDSMAGVDTHAPPPMDLGDRVRGWLRERTAPWMVSHMLASEPPDHARLRGVVQSAFSPGAMRALVPEIERYAERLLRDSPRGEQFDLLETYAFPLPVLVICHILGVPERHRAVIGRCSRVLSDVIVADPREMRRAALDLARVIYPLLVARARAPRDDLLSHLTQARKRKELTLPEVMSTVALLLIAGHETTMNLILNATHELLGFGTWGALASGEVDVSGVVAETLRLEPPLPTTTLRVAFEDTDIAGVPIRKGEIVMVSLGAANRDAAAFPEPNTFDPQRRTRGHLGFGHGIHRCVGAPLAQLEGEIALTKLSQAYPTLKEVGDTVDWRPSVVFRGMTGLMVRDE